MASGTSLKMASQRREKFPRDLINVAVTANLNVGRAVLCGAADDPDVSWTN
jgi:hypothetical protein